MFDILCANVIADVDDVMRQMVQDFGWTAADIEYARARKRPDQLLRPEIAKALAAGKKLHGFVDQWMSEDSANTGRDLSHVRAGGRERFHDN